MSDTPERVSTDPRFSRRRLHVARSKRRRTLILAGVAVFLVVAVWATFWSPLLNVRRVRVIGAERTPDSAVVAATGLMGSGQNVLSLSTALVEARVEALPWVRAAEVKTMLPGSVVVRVEERKPALVLSLGTERWTIDRRGYVLEEGVAEKNLPALAGVEVGVVEPGIKLLTREARDALAAFRSLPGTVERQVDGVFAPTIERITFSLQDGTVIRFGAAENLAAKNEVLRAVLARLRREGRTVAYIDVRVPATPAIFEGSPLVSPSPGASPLPSPSPSVSPSASPSASPSLTN